MKLEFGYGAGVQTVELPEKNLIGVLESNPMQHERTGPDAVQDADPLVSCVRLSR